MTDDHLKERNCDNYLKKDKYSVKVKAYEMAILGLISSLLLISPAGLAAPASVLEDIPRILQRIPGFSRIAGKDLYHIGEFSPKPEALNEDAIGELAIWATSNGGPRRVGIYLADLEIPETNRIEILEDTYLRILVAQKKLVRHEAEEFFKNLKSTPGFRETLRKISGNNPNASAGHLNELRLASSARRLGFNVREIAMPFNDGLKAGQTDIDLILEYNGNVLAIEAKDYSSSTRLPMDSFRADMDSLVQYQNFSLGQNITKVFTLSHKPENLLDFQLIQKETSRRGVELFIGTPDEIMIQFRQLLSVIPK